MLQRTQNHRSGLSERQPYMSSKWVMLSAQKRSAECALVELQTQRDKEIKQLRMEKVELESEKMQLEQNCNILKVKNETLSQDKEHTSTQLHESERDFRDRLSQVVNACNTVESSLVSEAERLREETVTQQKHIADLERSEAQYKAKIIELEASVQARAQRLEELESFVEQKKQELEECNRLKDTVQELEEAKRTLENRLALSENRPSIPVNYQASAKGPTYVVKLEMEHERLKTAYKTLSKERADWLITKEENLELRAQVDLLKQWRQRALTAENALEERQNLPELASSPPIASSTRPGSLVSPGRLGHLERENQLLLAELGELRARANELQSKLDHALSQLHAVTEHRDTLLDHVRKEPPQGSVRWADADLITTPLQKLQPVESPAQSQLIVELRHRISELEDQLIKMESDKLALQDKVEQFELKGLHEPQCTRILTLKANPAAEVKQTLSSEVTRLRQENERFRQRIKVLEECTVRLRRNQTNNHPLAADEPTMGSVTMVVNERLNEHPDPLTELEEVREQLRVERLRSDRLMELFDKASARFRGAFRELLGYRVDVRSSDEYKVRPLFASDPTEFLMFKRVNGQLELKENEFTRGLSSEIRAFLGTTPSFPGFFAALTLSYVQQTTMVT